MTQHVANQQYNLLAMLNHFDLFVVRFTYYTPFVRINTEITLSLFFLCSLHDDVVLNDHYSNLIILLNDIYLQQNTC